MRFCSVIHCMDGRVQLPLIRYLPKRFNVDYVDSITEVGHHDCAGNPAPKNDQIVHLQKAIQSIRQQYENIEVIGLWVDKNWEVHEID